MSLPELSKYLEQTIQKYPIISLIYLERCVDRASQEGPCYSRRQEAEILLKEIKSKAQNGHKDSQILLEVINKIEPVMSKIGA